jgi:hypothetical protein
VLRVRWILPHPTFTKVHNRQCSCAFARLDPSHPRNRWQNLRVSIIRRYIVGPAYLESGGRLAGRRDGSRKVVNRLLTAVGDYRAGLKPVSMRDLARKM